MAPTPESISRMIFLAHSMLTVDAFQSPQTTQQTIDYLNPHITNDARVTPRN